MIDAAHIGFSHGFSHAIDVDYEVESSHDLQHWTPTVPIDAASDLTLRRLTFERDGAATYLRLRLTLRPLEG